MGKGTIHDLELQATMKMRPKSLRLNRLRLPLNGSPDFIRVFGLKWRINYSYIIFLNNKCQEKNFFPFVFSLGLDQANSLVFNQNLLKIR